VLSMLASPFIYPNAPQLLQAGLGAAFLWPTTFILKQLLERELRPILYALLLLYLVGLIRTVASPLVYFSRLLYAAELLGALLYCLWLWRAAANDPKRELPRHLITVSRIAVCLIVSALIANLLGYVSLSNLVGNTLLRAAFTAMILYGVIKIADGLLLFTLRVPPLALLGFVRNHRARIRRRLRHGLEFLAGLLWLAHVLELLSLRTSAYHLVAGLLETDISLGALHFSIGDLVAFGLTIWGSFAISTLVRFVLDEDVYPRTHLAKGLPYAISTVTHYVILIVGFLVAVATLGLDTTKFAVLAGAIGVGLGLGLQNIVNNFVSGMILLFERPVNVGDYIQFGNYQGTLRRIGLRASVLRTPDGSEVIIPNAQLIADNVTNWTLSDANRRLEVKVGVDCAARPDEVIAVLVKVAVDHPNVLKDPMPRALFVEFGNSSNNYTLQAWTANAANWVITQNELMLGVEKALREANINVPYPQMELRVLKDADAAD
jgi:potassium efflux system protein